MDHPDPTRHPEPPQSNLRPSLQSKLQPNLQSNPQFDPQRDPPSGVQPDSQLDSQLDSQPESQSDSQPDASPPSIQHRLVGDLRQVIDNAEDLLNCTDSARDGAYRAAREKLVQALATANDELQRIEDAQLERMIAATHEASIRHNDNTGEARLFRAFH